MKACKQCGKRIPARMIVNGIRRNLKGRKYCFECSPFGQHNTTQLDGRKQKQCKAGYKGKKDLFHNGHGLLVLRL